MTTLDGARVVVFGASSGVGRAAAKRAGQLGARVVLVGREAARLEEARAEAGAGAQAFVVDGRDAAALPKLFADVGAIRHLFVPAGMTDPAGKFVGELQMDGFKKTFEDKFWVQMAVAHAAAPHVESGGSITLVSGGAAHRALPGMVNVAAVNGAIEAVVPTLARELAPTRVNCISPGTLNTGYWRGVPDEALQGIFGRVAGALPAGRVGTADDVAEAAVFLMTSSFVTGQVLQVDGGLELSSL
jgi:NAD(P)-dependent dehydrogenase (short-subunit alcohol dehydrogenase family)